MVIRENMNILLIDECKDLLDAYTAFFESNGHTCFSTMSLTTAISAIGVIDFDLIITEYDFLGSHPFTLLKKLLAYNNSTKIVILTNFLMMSSDIEKLHALEIDTILEKPITPKLLLEIINKSKPTLSISNI